MTEKTIFKWLEKTFANEVNLALKVDEIPIQLPKKQAQELIEMGYIEPMEIRNGNFSAIFHRLSHKGRMYYCCHC